MPHATAGSFLAIPGVAWFWILTVISLAALAISLGRRFQLLKLGRADDRFDRVGERIDLRIAPALDTLDALLASGESGSFDIAFIDADKSAYPEYFKRVLPLMRAGGLMVADNVLRGGLTLLRSLKDAEVVKLPFPSGIRVMLVHPHLRLDTRDRRKVSAK